LRILLVDDNESITKFLSKYLQAQPEKYQIGVANNGFQALDYYSKFKPNLVLLDISMPGMDGIQTLTRIFEKDKDANVIMATANDSLRTIEACLDRGALGYLTKPFSPEEFASAIKIILDGGIYKRDLITFFSRAANKLESSIQKIVNTSVSVSFKDIEIIPHYVEALAPKLVLSVQSTGHATSEPNVHVPPECSGFSMEVGGQINGTIISVINKDDLNFFLDKDDSYILEFFNVINTDVISQLSDSMNVKLDAFPIRHYLKDKDSKVKGHDLTKIKFEISLREKIIPFEIYLWLNMGHLFKNLF